MVNVSNISAGVVSGLLALHYSSGGLYSPFSQNERHLLKGTATYLQRFEGNPQEALDYTRRTIEIVKQNKDFAEKIGQLEKEVAIASAQLTSKTPASVYHPVLNSFGNEINDIQKDKLHLPLGIIWSLVSLGWLLNSRTWKKKD